MASAASNAPSREREVLRDPRAAGAASGPPLGEHHGRRLERRDHRAGALVGAGARRRRSRSGVAPAERRPDLRLDAGIGVGGSPCRCVPIDVVARAHRARKARSGAGRRDAGNCRHRAGSGRGFWRSARPCKDHLVKIGVLGATGPAGKGLAARLADVGHEVLVGSRERGQGRSRRRRAAGAVGRPVSPASPARTTGGRATRRSSCSR